MLLKEKLQLIEHKDATVPTEDWAANYGCLSLLPIEDSTVSYLSELSGCLCSVLNYGSLSCYLRAVLLPVYTELLPIEHSAITYI